MRKLKLILAALASTLLLAGPSRADTFVLVRNAKNSTASVTKPELRAIFTGKQKQWSSGKLVQTVLGGEGSPDLGYLADSIFGVGEVALLTKIKQEVFKGEMKRPISCSGDDDCIAQVKANEGGIAIVSSAAAAKLPAGVLPLTLSN